MWVEIENKLTVRIKVLVQFSNSKYSSETDSDNITFD